MPVPVKIKDLVDAFDWVSADGSFENAAYVSRETGKVYWKTGDVSLDEEELPVDLDDDESHVPVPSKRDLDLGRRLALGFVEEHAPDAFDRALLYFSKPGAYARFKRLLEEIGKLEAWYEYEERAIETALRQWADDNGLEVSEDGIESPGSPPPRG